MSEMKFTPAQQDAIEASGGSIIVSAAAGSGKTRVLVQRVIRLLTDKNGPVDADRLLIVTFTKAAAEEMKSRISAAIDEILLDDPDNAALRRQQLLLANADICTIHSFCSRIVRENFYQLDIDQDFRIISEGEANVLKQKLMSDIIEECYDENSQGFAILSDILSNSRSDKELEKTLLNAYIKSSSHPFPSLWLDTVSSFYDPEIPVDKTIFADVAYSTLRSSLSYIHRLLSEAELVILREPAFCTKAESCGKNKLDYLKGYFEELDKRTSEENWSDVSSWISAFQKHPYRKPTSKKDPPDESDCTVVKNCFDTIDSIMLKKLLPIFGIDEETYKKDTELVYPAVLCMCDILKKFENRYFEAKKERGSLDFSDLEHLMLRLLVSIKDGRPHKTEFAKLLSGQYDQIMVDEYQDTNETQELIFRAVSKDEKNLFVVGDVKQSIYRFREAMPEIFKKRRSDAVLYDREEPQFPAKIILDKNFRSCEGVIDSVNYVFRSIMSPRVGEIEYNDEEKLVTGASYPPGTEPETELHILDVSAAASENDGDEAEDTGTHEQEAAYIAGLIKRKIREGCLVTENGVQRPARYSDFAILMRFLSSNGHVYADTLERLGVPACVDMPYSLFECYEVNIALSLLKLIDNPLQDIPVLGVLLCPVFGFTADELADLKSVYKGKYLYYHIVSCADEDGASSLCRKCVKFMELFSELRRLSVISPASKVLDAFFEMTGFTAVVSAMDNGDIRVKNVHKLMSFIRGYEECGKTEVSDLVRHIAYLEENGNDISVGDTAPAECVRIMSIHHSKGLEFPICILADLGSRGNRMKDEVMYHGDLGFGIKTMDRDNMLKFNTLQRNMIDVCKEREEKSEAMRVLYVAMTRAKEKLIPVITVASRSQDGLVNKLKKLASIIMIDGDHISSFTVDSSGTLSDWLLMCALAHPDMKELRSLAGMYPDQIINTPSRWKLCLGVTESTDEADTDKAVEEAAIPDEELISLLEKRFSSSYPHSLKTQIPSKVSASTLVHNDMQLRYAAGTRPAFMQDKNMTGAEKGTAMHAFMQYARLEAIKDSFKEEKQRLVDDGFITKEQADVIGDEDIARFIKSSVYSHMMNGREVLREYRFTVNIDSADIDPSYPSGESVILQGAIDCLVFEEDGIIIIDYKTDRVKEVTELAKRYSKQLLLYKKAASQLFGLPVKKCLIYSFHKGEETEVLS